ncbi:uncharacterized protein [Anabrus simplex]|uniref:uncharacterized protein n=1 Tax=Anabrus simplex TaxID=316456 RepID=UPI0035A2C53E
MAPSSDTVSRDDGNWITNEFLQEVIEKDNPSKKVSIISKDIQLAVGKGENYLSIIFRVEAEYKQENSDYSEKCHLIIKGLPDGDYIRKFIFESGVFVRELSIYQTALPLIYRFAEEKLKTVPAITPKAFVTSRDNTVVLEDLKYKGFRMANRKNMLNLQHCKVVVRNMARLHGMSAAFHKYNPGIINQYTEIFLCEKNRENMEKFVPVQLNCLLKSVQSWPGFETYAAKLEKYIPFALDRVIKVCELQESGFHVLTHGDCWTNNYLFKYSLEGEPIEVCFIDFQLSRIGSPATDLSYFMYSSPQNEIRTKHMDQLLREYHTELEETLTALGCDPSIFTFQDLKNEMKRLACYGLFAASSIMPIVVADAEDTPDLAEITEDDINRGETSYWEKIQKNPRFKEVLQHMLPHFDELGVFDN